MIGLIIRHTLAIAFAISIPAVAMGARVNLTLLPASGRPWLGFGYNQYPQDRDAGGNDQPWTDAHWSVTTARMAAIAPALVRINLYRDWFNADAAGNPLPVGQYHFDTPAMASYVRVIRWYKDHHIPVMTGLWSSSHSKAPQDRAFNISSDFAAMQCDLLHQLIDVEKLSCIRWYTPVNEPGGSGISQKDWSTMIHQLASAMKRRGLPSGILAGADTWDGWTEFAADSAHDVLSAYDHHKYVDAHQSWLRTGELTTYLSGWVARVDHADTSRHPIFLSECAATDPDSIDYWFKKRKPGMPAPIDADFALDSLDFGVQTAMSGEAGALAWALDGFDRGKDPGMWNITGANGGTALRPWFYVWSLLCRAFPAESTMYLITGAPQGLRGVVARTPDGWALAIVNRSRVSQDIQLHLPADPSTAFALFFYSPQTPIDGESLSLSAQRMSLNVQSSLFLHIADDAGVVGISQTR